MKKLSVARQITAISCSALLMAGCTDEKQTTHNPAPAPAPAAATAAAAADVAYKLPSLNIDSAIVATHYFGQHWAKNIVSAFRREHVSADLKRIRDDGFNTVIFLASWGDLQPKLDPCCSDDPRAMDRLEFLIEQAKEADLRVIIRVGYAWTFHPDAGDSGARVHELLNDPATRDKYFMHLRKLQEMLKKYDHVVMTFMSWEDQWLHRADDRASGMLKDYFSGQPSPPVPLPKPSELDSIQLNGYWDYLVMEHFFKPGLEIMPTLSYEVRIDKDPRFEVAPDGTKTVMDWIPHAAMYKQPGPAPVSLYWAPFWGAANQGEKLPAERSLELLNAMLEEAQDFSGGQQMFINQFNFIDNTPGYEKNAVLEPDEIELFLSKAVCRMKDHKVMGYGLWTGQDYHESPLYNPSFSYGMDGWKLVQKSPHEALIATEHGDNDLELRTSDRLTQIIPIKYGRLPKPDDRNDWVCVDATPTDTAVLLKAHAGSDRPATLTFAPQRRSRQCTEIESRPTAEELKLTLESNGEIALHGVWLYDHIQFGGIYTVDGEPGPYLPAIRKLNQDFLLHEPAQCAK